MFKPPSKQTDKFGTKYANNHQSQISTTAVKGLSSSVWIDGKLT